MDDEDVKINEEYYSKGILEGGIDGVFRHNDKLFNEVKSGTWSQTFHTPNIDYKVGAVDGVHNIGWLQAWGISILFGFLFKTHTSNK